MARPSSLVESLEEEDDPQTARRMRSRSPRRKRIPREALTVPVEKLLEQVKKNPSMISDQEPRTGREQLSNDDLIRQLITELADTNMIEAEGLKGSLEDIGAKLETGLESLSSLQIETLSAVQQSDYANSIKVLGENMRVLDRSIKTMNETMKMMMEKIDLLYSTMAISNPTVPMLPSHPGPSKLYPTLPTAPTAEDLDIIP
ncbi:phosphoprotein [Parrot bornavirus 1]|uniref:Phosphoprotein n=1 Tax=Parrot bornavirus 1 TaxID=1548714 RepID=I6ZY70_9MONO|nr:phosphoprotein [Parrot bornavirus 1]